MVQASNGCNFLIAVKLSVKIADQPDALVNCRHYSAGWFNSSHLAFVEWFAHSLTLCLAILITSKMMILKSNFWLELAKTLKPAFTGSIVTRLQRPHKGIFVPASSIPSSVDCSVVSYCG